MKISIVINCDTRPERSNNEEMFRGVVDREFLTDGVTNKINLFAGFDIEVITYIDEHEPVKEFYFTDTIAVRKHTDEVSFNDWNYIRALQLATGDYIFHFDQDVAAFTISTQPIQDIINTLEQVDYVSYPSHWSPRPVYDETFDHVWVSTRFFACKRETLDLHEIIKCLKNYDYWCATYPVNRKCHWLEHILGSISKYKGKGVYYPPLEFQKFILYTWENYHKGTLKMLNEMNFEEVYKWVSTKNYHYPNNLTI